MTDGPTPPPDTAPAVGRLSQLFRPERVYLVLALCFGLAYLVVTPPFQVPDEPAHFRRAYELSEGRVVAVKRNKTTGDDQPRAMDFLEDRYARFFLRHEEKLTAAEILDGTAIRIDPHERTFAPFPGAAVHPPLTYVPQAIGIFLARHLSGSILVCLYAGRLANLLAVAAVMFLAIRTTPAGKWSFAALALTPMAMALTASQSSDALTDALAFLFVAWMLALALPPRERVDGRSLAIAALLGMGVGLSKQAYFLLSFCYLMIPPCKLGSPLRYYGGLALVVGATLLPVGSWSTVVRKIYSPTEPGLGMNPEQQFRLILADPVEFLFVLLRTTTFTRLYAEEFVGRLGFLDLRLPSWVYMVELSLLPILFATELGPRSGVKARQALVAAGVALVVTLTVLVVIHLTWDRVGARDVSLQGRYFIPLGPLVALVVGQTVGRLAQNLFSHLARAIPLAVPLAVAVVLPTGLARIYERFYVDSPEWVAERCYQRALALAKNNDQAKEAREAFEEAIHMRPEHVASRVGMANLLARRGEFPDAIRVYGEALHLDPANTDIKSRLAEATRAQEATDQVLRQIPATFQELIRTQGLSEKRYPNTSGAGTYLKPNRGRVLESQGRSPFPDEFVWRVPAPSGEEIRLSDSAVPVADRGPAPPFFACGTSPVFSHKRIFVFPLPVGAIFLADDEMSWFFQRPLADLSTAQLQREYEYRRRQGVRFPLAKLPE
jgi:uncharacterized membrane protein